MATREKPVKVHTQAAIDVLSGKSNDADATECLLALERTPNVWRIGGAIDNLRNLGKWNNIPEGKVIHDLLVVFYKALPKGVNYALAQAYTYMCSISRQFEKPGPDHITRFESPSDAKQIAVQYVGDAQVALSGWIEQWSKNENKKHENYLRKIQNLH